jgi:hypothetical protein
MLRRGEWYQLKGNNMKQNEIIEELNRLKGEIDRLKKELNKPQDETIYVPKGILRDNKHSIINGKQTLSHDEYGWFVYTIPFIPESTEKQYKLVPCERKDLKAGDVALCYLQCEESDINYVKEDLSCYCIVTEKGIVHWEANGVFECDYELNSDYIWYKVVKA